MKEKSFEEKLLELEKISNDLENENDLEKSVKLYEKAKTLADECQEILNNAQQKIIEISNEEEGKN